MGCCHLSTVTPWLNAPPCNVSRARPACPASLQPGTSIYYSQVKGSDFPSLSFLQTSRVAGLSTSLGLKSSDNSSPSPLTRAHKPLPTPGGCHSLFGKEWSLLGTVPRAPDRLGASAQSRGMNESNNSNNDKDFFSPVSIQLSHAQSLP